MRICKQGWPFVIGCFIVGSMLLEVGQVLHRHELGWLAGVAFLAAAYCAYFFRDPTRTIPAGNQWILSPADGKILEITEARDEISGQTLRLIRIFLSIFDVQGDDFCVMLANVRDGIPSGSHEVADVEIDANIG